MHVILWKSMVFEASVLKGFKVLHVFSFLGVLFQRQTWRREGECTGGNPSRARLTVHWPSTTKTWWTWHQENSMDKRLDSAVIVQTGNWQMGIFQIHSIICFLEWVTCTCCVLLKSLLVFFKKVVKNVKAIYISNGHLRVFLYRNNIVYLYYVCTAYLQAFMKGLLKLKGNMMLAQKLGSLFGDSSKL